MSAEDIDVLYEDNHLLAVNKPAGMLSVGDDTGDASAFDLAADYLKVKYNKPGNVFVGVVHRLDRPVSGVLLFARTSKAASRLSDQFRRRSVRKRYLALVEGRAAAGVQELEDCLAKDERTNTVSVVGRGDRRGKLSRLTYECLRTLRGQSLLRVEPLTGRSHQIRVQLASRGLPILGDLKYGARQGLGHRILLHAAELHVDHPTQKHRLTITADCPFDEQSG
ncbi:MAG: RluA family pseudouridine synthase [Planctomycetaceae bacterium]|nr:RluA family pseudouridine synthase [Planctomycetaceae bacterium]